MLSVDQSPRWKNPTGENSLRFVPGHRRVSFGKEPNIVKTKGIVGWSIVLFLLVALPGLTAALAQGQEPVKQLPAVSEPSESAAPLLYNKYESEPNNTRATADPMAIGDVMGGNIYESDCDAGLEDDIDWFSFQVTDEEYILVDVDTDPVSYFGLDTDLCLLNAAGEYLACSDDTDGFDPKVYWSGLESGGTYYIHISEWEAECMGGGENANYEINLSSPLLISAAASNLGTGTVAGIPFRSEDILAWSDLNTGEEKWAMFFDGSDANVIRNVTNIAAGQGDGILLSLAANQTFPWEPALGTVTPWDILLFSAEDLYQSYGNNTFALPSLWMPGRDNGLTTAAEKLDALDYDVTGPDLWYDYIVSTLGVAVSDQWSVYMKADDEDVFGLTEDWGGSFDWYRFFDVNGKNDGLNPGTVAGLPAEDVTAVAYNEATGQIYLTIQGNGRIAGHRVTQKDIFAINYPSYTWGGYVWRGPDHGWNYNIDAFEWNGW